MISLARFTTEGGLSESRAKAFTRDFQVLNIRIVKYLHNDEVYQVLRVYEYSLRVVG